MVLRARSTARDLNQADQRRATASTRSFPDDQPDDEDEDAQRCRRAARTDMSYADVRKQAERLGPLWR
jgi:hypothetical protein